MSNYRHIKAVIFDPEYAMAIGINVDKINAILLAITVLAVVIGIRSLGCCTTCLEHAYLPGCCKQPVDLWLGYVLFLHVYLALFLDFLGWCFRTR